MDDVLIKSESTCSCWFARDCAELIAQRKILWPSQPFTKSKWDHSFCGWKMYCESRNKGVLTLWRKGFIRRSSGAFGHLQHPRLSVDSQEELFHGRSSLNALSGLRTGNWGRHLLVIVQGQKKMEYVKQPQEDWQPGQKQPHPFPDNEMIELDPAELGKKLYPFIISSIIPRPIAFISSLSKEVELSHSPRACMR